MDGTGSLLDAQDGKKITTLAVRRASMPFGKIKYCSLARDGRIAIHFEEKITGVPESLVIDETPVKIAVEGRRTAKGTIFSRDLIGCSEDELAMELKEQVTKVKALPSRVAKTNSGRFLLIFPEDVPELVRLNCGLQLSVRSHVPMPLRCRSCFVYGHHEK